MKTDADKLRSFLRQVVPIVETYGRKSVINDIENAIAATEDSTTILFCGEFKRGKSSLVNAIVEADLCPTDIGVATSVITTIKYGAAKKAVRYYGNLLENPDSLKTEEIEWNDIGKFTMGDVLEIDNTILVELSYPSPFLQNGITIIDTPGIGGLDPRHAILTQIALPKADVIVFVTDAGEPLTQSEQNFYENKVLPCKKNNVVLVNKSDILTSETLVTHINNTKLELSKLESPEVVPVSAKCWVLYSKFEDNEYLLSSNRDAVLTTLTMAVETSKINQYKAYRDVVIAELSNVRESMLSEVQQVIKDTDDKLNAIEELQRQLASLSRFKTDLNNPTSQIRLKINSIFEDARNDVQNLISHEGRILTSTEFDTLLESEHGLENDGRWLVAQINEKLQKLSRKVDDMMNDAFDKISESIEREITNIVGTKSFILSNEFKIANVINSQLAFSIAGKVMTGSFIGGFVGGVGLLINPVVGIIAGITTAVALIWKQLSSEAKQQKRISLKQQVLPKVDLAITDMRNQANVSFTKFHQNLLSTLQTIIGEIEEKMKALQASIQESIASEHQSKEKVAELEQKIKFCETLISQMKLLYSKPFSDAQ
ncbi:MAG: dynamin family protein [archaeon]|nr:dynamin family protein [archaeon]